MSDPAIRPKPYLVTTGGGFADGVRFWVGSASTPDVLDGMTVTLKVQPPHVAAVDLSAFVTIAGNMVSWAIPSEVTENWRGGDGQLELRVRPAAASLDRHIFLAKVQVRESL